MEPVMTDSIAIAETSLSESPSDASPIYSQRDLWYFRTSDGTEVGPFRYRSEAETGLNRFLGSSASKH